MATSTDRGYGWSHRRERARWREAIAAGQVNCWRCNRRIVPGTAWDLGHDDHDRSVYRGPEHAYCNRSAAGKNTPHVTQRRPAERHPGLIS